MNLIGIAETEVKPNPSVMLHHLTDSVLYDKPAVLGKYHFPDVMIARAEARQLSNIVRKPARFAVYNKLGFLDCVYQNGERVVSRCD